MKTLVIYYSRTGNTRKVANAIAKSLKADIEEIEDNENRMGIGGYLKSGMQATLKKTSEIRKLKKNPSKYGLVIIGTPIWSWSLIPPIRFFLNENKGNLKKTAFFCTEGGSGGKRVFKGMQELCRKKPLATSEIFEKEVKNGSYVKKVKIFTSYLSNL